MILYPWKMVGSYEDDYSSDVGGENEHDCIYKLIILQKFHGKLVWYSGFCDEDYVNGEYVGRENFIYD